MYVSTPLAETALQVMKGLVGGPVHRRLQAWAYPGIARIISNYAYSHHAQGPDAKTRGHLHIAYACTDVHIAYSVVTKYAFCNCASNAT